MNITDIRARLDDVETRIAKAAKANGCDPKSITLIAVSKGHDAAAAAAAVAAGQRQFGENRVQEAKEKWPRLKSDKPVTLHLIGPLQTNKIRDALGVFDTIHTLDRPRLAEKLAEELAKHPHPITCFVQVNTGREPQKAGIDPHEADAFIESCRTHWKLPVVGLMCIPPVNEEPSLHFALLREIARRHGLTQLSMGMSDDFEIAVAFGATHVRVGTAIFGPRRTNQI